jgi:hypothetical protein
MARTDPNLAFDPARFAKTFGDIPLDALARLPLLQREAGRDLHLSQLLSNAPRFCVALMLAGVVTLIWISQERADAPAADFFWATAILIGIAAMTWTTIRGFARSPRLVPLRRSASELRLLLLFVGADWGIGAFLVMPALPSPALALAFGIGPTLACALILKDLEGVIAFGVPASLLTAGAALLGGWPRGAWVAGTILAAGVTILGLSMLRCAIRERRDCLSYPALR